MVRCSGLAVFLSLLSMQALADEPAPFQQPAISVPEGYSVELAAAPPLVTHPIMAGFDERGRLYVAETAGHNMQRAELEEKLPNFVTRLEDTDGDGKFDKRTTFADKLTFPQGALWHEGWLYVASSGAIWRFRDKDDDGVAEIREKIVSSFGYTGNAADVHGCFLGPEGRIWWCEGRHGHDIVDAAGQSVSKGKAARIFSCRLDGSDVQIHCGGGMDNPVEIDWTDEGEVLGTVNIFYHKRGDCLVHWMHGGVYPRHDQPQIVGEFRRTGDLLDAVHDYGHVAVSGTCRLRSESFLDLLPSHE
ncbi:MAG TPA: PVC-type heme-binding CxxCH protein, partial [Pirellulaceae bacterium]|nr:PVC-type heme-binding CxxCH protein [Pirellulaceae bacterium]